MKNRRSRNTIHKKYRRYRSDIWGILRIKQRNNFRITYSLVSVALIALSAFNQFMDVMGLLKYVNVTEKILTYPQIKN